LNLTNNKLASLLDEIKETDFDPSTILENNKTLQEKDELITQLFFIIKNFQEKVGDIENTSRANLAMLDNEIKKKQDVSASISQNNSHLLYKLNKQNEYLNSLNELNLSTESSENSEEESKIGSRKASRDISNFIENSIQTDPRPSAFPFGCQTNFSHSYELKIKELEQLLVKQEESFQIQLEEAKKIDDVEDAFQAFLDQLDLNENEERIIIDGESRVWKIIRCSKSIIEDECLEEEEEETEEEKQAESDPQKIVTESSSAEIKTE